VVLDGDLRQPREGRGLPRAARKRGRVNEPRATRFETLGAWLHVWTPRRGVYVPPPPSRRKLAVWTTALGVPLAVALAVGLTQLAHARHDEAARERAEAAAVQAQVLARQRVEQLPRHGRATPVPIHSPRARVLQARHALVRDLERAITADARARVRAGKLEGSVAHTSCAPYTTSTPDHPPEPPLRARTGRYDCLAITASVDFGSRLVRNGFPFWARIHYATGRYTWCKINRVPGESVANHAIREAPLARDCDLTRLQPGERPS
jgi:hypothetical protein